MRTRILPIVFVLSVLPSVKAQNVGINSTGASPNASAMLDVVSTTSGILIPRMTAAQRTAIASPATGLLVYQTNASAPIPADQFWFYDGTAWRPLFTDRIGWSIWGNTGTTPGTNFLGTTDNVGLRIKTNNADRFEFTNNGRIRAYDNGTAAQPTYSWYGASGGENTGIYRPAASVLGFSTGGNERFRIPNGFQVHAMSNGTAAAPFYSWSTNAGTGMFQQAANVIGLSTNGTERFRIPNANQVHAVSNGTAAFPFYSWSANTNLGMYRATTNVIGFATAGTERMRIGDYSGSVGIGRVAQQGMLGTGPIVDIYQPLEIGNDGAGALQATIGYWVNADVMVNPEADMYGYVGVYALPNYNAWWEMNSYAYYTISNREAKRNITRINTNDAMEALVMADIERIQPSFYDYKGSHEKPQSSQDNRYRPQFTLGVITDESPDYLLGQTFDKVNIYSLATLALAGVKHNLKAVKRLEATVQDFGSMATDQARATVSYDGEFIGRLNGAVPVVNLTATGQGQRLSILEKTPTGFVVVNEEGGSVSFDWVAMAKVQEATPDLQEAGQQVAPEIRERMHLSPEKKQEVMQHFGNIKITREPQRIGE